MTGHRAPSASGARPDAPAYARATPSDGAGRHARAAGDTRPMPTRVRAARVGTAPAGGNLGHTVRLWFVSLDRRTLRHHRARCARCKGGRPEWRRPRRLFAPCVTLVALFLGAVAVGEDRTPFRLVTTGDAGPSPTRTLPAGPVADSATWVPVILGVGCLAAVAVVLLAAYAWRNRRGRR